MYRLFLGFSVLVFASSAFAQKAEKPVTQMSVSLEDCKRVMKHPARSAVAHKSGNKKLLGAISPPDEIVIDFGLDLAGRYGFGGAALYDATAGIVSVQYDSASDGLLFNGKPLRIDDARAIKRACAMGLKPN